MSPTRVNPPAAVVKTEMKEERCDDEHVDEEMPTDLSMSSSESWRKRQLTNPSAITPQHDKHRISALIGENMMRREPDFILSDHYALNLKSEVCDQ